MISGGLRQACKPRASRQEWGDIIAFEKKTYQGDEGRGGGCISRAHPQPAAASFLGLEKDAQIVL